MTTQPDLADRFRRLATALDNAEHQVGGILRADGIRTRLAGTIDAHLAELTKGKAATCERHPGSPAHNCGPCRSERIGADQ